METHALCLGQHRTALMRGLPPLAGMSASFEARETNPSAEQQDRRCASFRLTRAICCLVAVPLSIVHVCNRPHYPFEDIPVLFFAYITRSDQQGGVWRPLVLFASCPPCLVPPLRKPVVGRQRLQPCAVATEVPPATVATFAITWNVKLFVWGTVKSPRLELRYCSCYTAFSCKGQK
jgi:hypothetical protein